MTEKNNNNNNNPETYRDLKQDNQSTALVVREKKRKTKHISSVGLK